MSKRSRLRSKEARAPDRARGGLEPAAATLAPWRWMRAQVARRRHELRFATYFFLSIGAYFLLTVSLSTRDPAALQERPIVAALAKAGDELRAKVVHPYHRFIAARSATILDLLGQPVVVNGRELRSPSFTVIVTHGCDGIELSLLFVAAVMAYPARLAQRFVGVVVGGLIISLLNLARVVSLWLVGVHEFRYFDLAHFSLWPALLVAVTLALFLVWQRLASSAMEAAS